MNELLVPVLKLSVGALIFAIGLGSTPGDLGYLWRRPWLALRHIVGFGGRVSTRAVRFPHAREPGLGQFSLAEHGISLLF